MVYLPMNCKRVAKLFEVIIITSCYVIWCHNCELGFSLRIFYCVKNIENEVEIGNEEGQWKLVITLTAQDTQLQELH